jgi:2-polyprenyl-6-methoxyphenol hydroxylase-like FAD-dependent oxidoreductase
MRTDVLVVGAGPSGLVLANLLAERGVPSRLIDRKPGPVRESRAALLHVRTLELLDRLGLAGRAVERGVKINRVEVYERGRPAAAFPLVPAGSEGLTPFPFALCLEQDRTEQLLVEGLAERGGAVEWDTELLSFAAGEEGGAARVRRADGVEETISARWVVGADGASSPVRHALGLGFTGNTYEQTGLLADVEIGANAQARLDPGAIRFNLGRGGFVGMLSLSNGLVRLFGAVPRGLAAGGDGRRISHEAYAAVPSSEIQRWFDERFFVDATLERAEWSALFRIHSRIAERFRVGNTYLVGDAAHIHSPAGGQGMNLGIGDAFNLGWKLALVARGEARERLLDSYEAERRSVAQAVLRGADRGFALEATTHPLAEWARASVATRLVGPLLRLQSARRAVFRVFSQTWIGYRDSPAVAVARLAGPRPGDRAPCDAAIPVGTEHVLLLFEGRRPELALDARRQAIEDLLDRYPIRVTVKLIPASELELHQRYAAGRPRVFLIRPDGHLAYTGPATGCRALAAYLDGLYPASRSRGYDDRGGGAAAPVT